MPLGSIWHQWRAEAKFDLVAQLVDFEVKLAAISFRKHGCLYYTKGLERRGHAAHKLEAWSATSQALDTSLTEDFTLGPLTEASLWEDEREFMDLHRGPCKSLIPLRGRVCY